MVCRIHLWLVQQDQVEYCEGKGIHVTAYSATRSHSKLKTIETGRNLQGELTLKDIAAKHGVSTIQAIFAWHMARGISISTQSRNEERRKEALNVSSLVRWCKYG